MIDVPGRSPLGVCYRSPLGVRGSSLAQAQPLLLLSVDELTSDALTFTKYYQLAKLLSPANTWERYVNGTEWPYETRILEQQLTLHSSQHGIKFSESIISDFVIVTPVSLAISEPTSEPDPFGNCIALPKETASYSCSQGGFLLSQTDYIHFSYYSSPGNATYPNLRRTYNFTLKSESDSFDLDDSGLKALIEANPGDSALSWAFNLPVRYSDEIVTLEDLISLGWDTAQPGEPLDLHVTLIPEGTSRFKFKLLTTY